MGALDKSISAGTVRAVMALSVDQFGTSMSSQAGSSLGVKMESEMDRPSDLGYIVQLTEQYHWM